MLIDPLVLNEAYRVTATETNDNVVVASYGGAATEKDMHRR